MRTETDRLKAAIRDVPDFPKPGIVFKDITPVLADPTLLREALDRLEEPWKDDRIDAVAGGIEARGFILGGALADRLGAGFVPVRKLGKLPWKTQNVSYELEYGTGTLEMHVDAARSGQRILLIDDGSSKEREPRSPGSDFSWISRFWAGRPSSPAIASTPSFASIRGW
jgi:adenine phosphoribosyltransferase